jgi:hypothetical protein
MILNNINEAKQFLPSLNLTLSNDRFNDFFRRGQAWLVSHVIGEEVEEILEMEVALAAPDDHAELRLLCQRVIAERALLDAIPEMDMQLTEAGFAVQQNGDFVPASSQRVDRLIAKMPERIAADADALVRFLMKNSVPSTGSGAAYVYWRSSDQFNYLTAAFMPLCEEYTAYCNGLHLDKKPSMNYEDFYAAIPMMARELRNVADYYVSRAEIDRLVELYRDNDLLEIHRKAIVNLKDCAVAALRHDMNRARNAAVQAREVMLSDPDSFTAFKASSAFNSPTVNLDGGKLVNML